MTVWTDTFAGRTVGAGGWGTASDGELYTVYGGAVAGLSVAGGEGICAGAASNGAQMRLGTTTGVDAEVRCRMMPGNAGDTLGLYLRITDSTHYYRLDIGGAGANKLRLGYKNGGGFTQVGGITTLGFSLVASTFYWLVFRMQGVTLLGRIWQDGNPDPGSWQVVGSDSTIATAGGVGLHLGTQSGGASTQNVDHFSAQTIPSIAGEWKHKHHKAFAKVR